MSQSGKWFDDLEVMQRRDGFEDFLDEVTKFKIPNYDLTSIACSPSSINEGCQRKNLIRRVLKWPASPEADYEDRDRGTFLHSIFELFHKSEVLRDEVLPIIYNWQAENFDFEFVKNAFDNIIADIIPGALTELMNDQTGQLSFDTEGCEDDLDNFVRLEIGRMTILIAAVGIKLAVSKYWLPIQTEQALRTSGELLILDNGRRKNRFDPDDPWKFSCIVDYIRVSPGALIGQTEDFYTCGDYKGGKNRCGWVKTKKNGRVVHVLRGDGEYGQKHEVQTVYPVMFAELVSTDNSLSALRRCTHYEVYYTNHLPMQKVDPRTGKHKRNKKGEVVYKDSIPGWRAGFPEELHGSIVGPILMGDNIKAKAWQNYQEYRQAFSTKKFSAIESKFFCGHWCKDYLRRCKREFNWR